MVTGLSCKTLVRQDTSTRGGEWLNYLRLCGNGRIAFFFTYKGSKTMNKSELWDLLAMQKGLDSETVLWKIYRGYYTVARRYEFYVRMARTISHEWAKRTSEILFLPREHKIHILEPTCNVLFIIWRLNIETNSTKAKGGNRDVIEQYDTHKGDIQKIRHSGPGWSGIWNLRVV